MTNLSLSVGRPKTRGLVLAGDPTVQLLPPAIRDRAKNRQFRQLMVLLVVLAVAIVAGGVAFGLFRSVSAQDALDAANAETQRLLAEQQQYAEDAAVSDVVDATRQAQELVTTSEVNYFLFVMELGARMEDFGTIETVSLAAPPAWGQALGAPAMLRETPQVAVTFTIVTKRFVTVADAVARFGTMTGYLDSGISGSTWEAGEGVYRTEITIGLSDEVYLGRFAADDEAAAEDEAVSEDPATEGAAQ